MRRIGLFDNAKLQFIGGGMRGMRVTFLERRVSKRNSPKKG
jgi:hypothetical protein